MKKTKLFLVKLLLLLLATYSCQVEELSSPPKDLNTVGTTKKINPIFLKHQFSDKNIRPNWESAITFNNVDAVEFTFTSSKIYYRPLSENGRIVGRQRLLLSFDAQGLVKETIIEYIP